MKLKRGAWRRILRRSPDGWPIWVPCHLRDQNIGFKSKELMECAARRWT